MTITQKGGENMIKLDNYGRGTKAYKKARSAKNRVAARSRAVNYKRSK